jgi:hypothetical protein
MKKPTLIRSDKPHAVKLTEGSSIAQRKSTAYQTGSTETPETPEPVKSAQPTPTVRTSKPRKTSRTKALAVSEPTPAPAPAPKATNPPKAKRKAKATVKTAVSKPRKKSEDKTPESIEASLPVTPVLSVWEQDNPVKARLEELQALNAQLSEQLQRLPTTRTTRGATP